MLDRLTKPLSLHWLWLLISARHQRFHDSSNVSSFVFFNPFSLHVFLSKFQPLKSASSNLFDWFFLSHDFLLRSVVRSTAGSIDQLPDEVAENQYLALSSTLLVLPECKYDCYFVLRLKISFLIIFDVILTEVAILCFFVAFSGREALQTFYQILIDNQV